MNSISRLPTLVVVVLIAIAVRAVADEKNYDVTLNVEYGKAAEQSLKCDLYVPHGDGPFPGVMLIHGGAWIAGRKENMSGVAERLADNGFTAVSINYRLAPQFTFPAQIDDCRTAVRWMRSEHERLKLDNERLAAFGYSAGGHLAALLGTTAEDAVAVPMALPSTRLRCFVAGGAPCEFRILPASNRRLAYWLGGSRAEKPDAYASASPLKFVSKDDAPGFFYHGEKDNLVPLLSPQVMVKQFADVGVKATLFTIPGAGHGAAFFDTTAIDAATTFLKEQLQ